MTDNIFFTINSKQQLLINNCYYDIINNDNYNIKIKLNNINLVIPLIPTKLDYNIYQIEAKINLACIVDNINTNIKIDGFNQGFSKIYNQYLDIDNQFANFDNSQIPTLDFWSWLQDTKDDRVLTDLIPVMVKANLLNDIAIDYFSLIQNDDNFVFEQIIYKIDDLDKLLKQINLNQRNSLYKTLEYQGKYNMNK